MYCTISIITVTAAAIIEVKHAEFNGPTIIDSSAYKTNMMDLYANAKDHVGGPKLLKASGKCKNLIFQT